MKHTIVFIVYVVLSAYGLYKIKLSENIVDIDFAIGFVSYFLGFLIWFYILRITPLSIAFPIAAGALIVATTVLGIALLGEEFNALKIVGALFIIVGITVVSIGANSSS